MRTIRDLQRTPGWVAMLRMICDPEEDVIWRVTLCKDGTVRMSYIGYMRAYDYVTKTYSTLDKLPEWLKDRIAVLRMMPPNPNDSVVYGVGRRIDDKSYWIVEPTDINAENAGSQGQS